MSNPIQAHWLFMMMMMMMMVVVMMMMMMMTTMMTMMMTTTTMMMMMVMTPLCATLLRDLRGIHCERHLLAGCLCNVTPHAAMCRQRPSLSLNHPQPYLGCSSGALESIFE